VTAVYEIVLKQTVIYAVYLKMSPLLVTNGPSFNLGPCGSKRNGVKKKTFILPEVYIFFYIKYYFKLKMKIPVRLWLAVSNFLSLAHRTFACGKGNRSAFKVLAHGKFGAGEADVAKCARCRPKDIVLSC
jgi:hypothetical protein